jgi:hypothetical protein
MLAVNYVLRDGALDTSARHYPLKEGPAAAVTHALAHWGNPDLSGETHRNLVAFSRQAQRRIRADWEEVTYRILRQNALRTLIPMTPDWQTC